jgi:hypothetical protein
MIEVPTIISEKEMNKWEEMLKTDDIDMIKKVLLELIETLRKTYIQY